MKKITTLLLTLLVVGFFMPDLAYSQKKKKKREEKSAQTAGFDEKLYDAVEWRPIGPWRGGRSAAATGVPGKPNLFYFGAAGGGLWKTDNGGRSWENISDGFFGGSVGSVAVSEYDPNVIYVGGGEVTVRGNVSSGYGIWKSEDAGKTWTSKGLEKSRHIPRIRIHPRDPDVVYAAVLGNIYAKNEERGVYRSNDGGDSWEKVLFVSDSVGAVDLTFDPTNPRILFASTWQVKRTPYSLESGGEGSGLWKSTDSGDTWVNITEHEGMPKGPIGIIGVTVSPVNPERVWAIVEAKEGGVFRSDNAGKSWRRINSNRNLRQRAWYYSRIYADPEDEDIVYVVNVAYHKSKDGGKNFESNYAPHGDHHDMWIAPEDPDRIIIADDGGAQITYDGGETWTTYYNQPTAQFYRVTTDNHFPFRIYVAQQDNSAIRISHRTSGGSIGERDWESTAGCECGHIAIDPTDNEIVYGGCYDGLLERKDHRTGFSRNVNVWPDNPMGHGVEGMKYRFQWNFPLFFSPHDPKKLYTASNHLHVTYDAGQSWEIISPDLTRNDTSRMGPSGGPITKDNTSVEYYCTIFAAVESPRVKDLIWAGSDDGLIHVTRDGGKNWENVTPPDMPEWIMINSIEADPFVDGGAYIAATMYKSGDFQPYLYKTKDFGKTWTKIVNGIGEEHFTRVVRADPKREGLLYAGTESGMYVSFDDGDNWQSFQLNLPIVPITDLTIKDDHLIAATQGRSVWLIDDLTPLHQLSDELQKASVHLFQPKNTWRMGGYYSKRVRDAGVNHPNGAMVYFYLDSLAAKNDSISLTFKEEGGTEIRSFSTYAKENRDKLKVEKGSNLFLWNLRYQNAERFEGMILWWASLSGPKAMPGKYMVELSVGEEVQSADFEVLQDPRSEVSLQDIQAQFDFVTEVCNKLTEAHNAIEEIRDIRAQLKNYTKRLPEEDEYKPIREQAEVMDSVMTEVEKALYQTKNRSGQDPLNFPIRLTNKLGHLNSLMGNGDYPPTDQAVAVKEELSAKIDEELDRFERVKEEALPKFNNLVRELKVDAIILEE
jgi:photosystem II stability/assembly factor-like uncharacterized protein